MLRHSINITADSLNHTTQLVGIFHQLKDGDCVKISQDKQSLYLTYRHSEQIHSGDIRISQKLLQLNQLSQGLFSVESCSPVKIDHLQVEVSDLDEKIISMNSQKIAQTMLQQVNFVWPQGKIPVYYNQTDCVVVHPLTKQVGRLGINTTVQFIKRQQKQRQKDSEDQQIDRQIALTLKTQTTLKNGHMNTIYINQSLYNEIKPAIGVENLWIIEDRMLFSDFPAINSLINMQKYQSQNAHKNESSRKIQKKLLFLQPIKDIDYNQFTCSRTCRKLLQLSQTIYISTSLSQKPVFAFRSLEVLWKSENEILQIQKLLPEGQTSTNEIENEIATYLINQIITQKYSCILQQSYPVALSTGLYLITLKDKKPSDKTLNNCYILNSISNIDEAQRQTYIDQLKTKIVVKGGSKHQTNIYLHQRYAQIQQWIKVVRAYQEELSITLPLIEKYLHIFSQVYQKELSQIIKFIYSNYRSEKILLVACLGSNGKTLLHHYLLKESRHWFIDFGQLSNSNHNFKQIDFYLHWLFASCPYSFIFIDNLHAFCAKIEDSDQHRKKQKVISKLILRKISKYICTYNKRVIATVKSQPALDQQLDYHITVQLRNPTRERRQCALRRLYPDMPTDVLNQIAQKTESLPFGSFCHYAVDKCVPQKQKTIKFDFSKIAGLNNAKKVIKSMIEKPLKYQHLFKSTPIKLPRGILLYGATGNGKTALGTAAADQFNLKYFTVKGSDILSKYIGGSEAAVREVFQKALSVSPSIIFFDQFQSIVPRRSANNTGVNDRIVNQFLCYLDGVSAINGVYIIAASSRPDLIDPAIIRPGRLDAHLFLDYPNEEERLQLIRMYSDSVRIETCEQDIVKVTDNFSYSDIIGLFKELRIKRSASVLVQESHKSQDFLIIPEELFAQTIKLFKKSVNEKEQNRQRKIYQSFREGGTPDIKDQKQVQQ